MDAMTSTPETPAGARGAVDLTALSGGAPGAGPAGGPSAGSSAGAGAEGGGRLVPEGLLIEATDANFSQVLSKNVTVPGLLVLWTGQHAQTRAFRDLVVQVAARYDGRVVVVSADLGSNPGLAQSLVPLVAQGFGQASIPATFGLLQGQPVPLLPGMAQEQDIVAAIDSLLEAAVRSGITGRVELVGGEDVEIPLPPLHQKAYDAIEAGDLDGAAAAYEEALKENPKDADAELGLAQVGLMKRTQDVDLQAARAAAAADPTDIDAALTIADLDVLGGHVEDAFGRLIDLVRATADEDRDRVRSRLIELFNVVGSHDDRVKKGRTALMNALF
jgi:putative thioredoxin